MERLILLRHGKAEAEAPSGQDFDRPLAERGRRDAALTARSLVEAGISPDLVLVSPAARTWQTWEALAPCFPGARVERASMLYHIEPDALLALVRKEGADARAVMVVGHNPGLGLLAAALAQDSAAPPQLKSRLSLGFPTAAAAVIDFEPPAFQLFIPKALGGGS